MLGDEVLAQLTEMFGDYIDQTRIQMTVRQCHDLQTCIDMLLKEESEFTEECIKMPSTASKNTRDMIQSLEEIKEPAKANPPPSTGAIKKIFPSAQQPANESLTFTSFLQKGTTPQCFGSQPQRNPGTVRRTEKWPPNFDSVVDLINKGYRVMVLMRGAPGSGKSFLSRALIDKTIANSDYRNHIFSADDYFVVNGVYKYQADGIDEAHRFNQNNVRAKARDGWSPIVVDNTHMRLWEMQAYVQIAADNGYYLEVLEPNTHWRYNARNLFAKNTHGVPEQKIKSMLANYEKLKDTTELYKYCKLEHALYQPTKMRHFPIIKEDLLENKTENSVVCQESVPEGASLDTMIKEWSIADWEPSIDPQPNPVEKKNAAELTDMPAPKPPRQVTPKHAVLSSGIPLDKEHMSNQPEQIVVKSEASDVPELNWPTATEISWKPYDEESVNFWTQSDPKPVHTPPNKFPETPLPKRTEQSTQDPTSLLLSSIQIPANWKTPDSTTGVTPIKSVQNEEKSEIKQISLVKHRRGCKNENTSFSEICNLYPQIPVQYLWDLFENCNGDGNWTANLLLEEQKNYEFEGASDSEVGAVGGQLDFECGCNETNMTQGPIADPSSSNVAGGGGLEIDRSAANSESPRNTSKRKEKPRSEDVQNAKKQLESFVVLGKEHYSKHLQQIRAAKGIISKDEIDQDSGDSETVLDDTFKPDTEVFEVNLGIELIKQLHVIFKDKYSSKAIALDELTEDRTKVFMAADMAEQLYLSFLDTVYSCREENKICKLKEDAQLAQQMEVKEKYPILFKKTNDTPNLNDIMEMEYALTAYRNEINGWTKQAPQDLASQMTRQKLAEMYPSVDEKVLAEILHAHHNKFNDTVTILNNSIPEELRNQIAQEREALLKRAEAEKQSPTPVAIPLPPTSDQGSPHSEDAINLHLKTAEECRNLSQHHQELKNECHEKARNAIQRGMAGVADYYSQVARLHRTKIDMYNSKASNAIMEVHKLTLNNADVLDLHYLHSEEALQCMALFLAEQARKLTTRRQQFKELFIITGRGLHSADGIPIIKLRVKAMLRDIGLRCTELNPGFLKIKLYNNPDMLERLISL